MADRPPLPLTGGCLCGAVRYELTAHPQRAGYCHCRRCQRRSGTAASLNALVAADAFRFVSGEELVREWKPDDGGAKHFCEICGSGVYSRNPLTPDLVAIRFGTFDSDPGVRPSFRAFVAYAAPWEPIPDDGLDRFPERRTS